MAKTRPKARRRPRPRKSNYSSETLKVQNLDAATLAATLQLQEQRRELIYSVFALALKFGFLALCSVSLLKLGIASHQRVLRHAELSSVLDVESAQLMSLQQRFDHLFTIGGDRRLMDEQDQWIAPNRVRVIWR